MDEKSQIINNFELILKRNSEKRTQSLYDSDNRQYLRVNQQRYSAQDIIENISCQIKTILKSDVVKNGKNVRYLNLYNKSTFLPVNMLSTNKKVLQKKQTDANRFETQCVSDVHLIHAIEDAEALHAYKGITQEFDTTFSHRHLDNENPGVDRHNSDSNENNQYLHVNIETNHNPNVEIINLNKHLNEINSHSRTFIKNEEKYNKASNVCFNSNDCKDIFETGVTHSYLNKDGDNNSIVISNVDIHIDQENNMFNDSTHLEPNKPALSLDRSTSPILTVKCASRISNASSSPLVFGLETFEKFERQTLPFAEDIFNINTTSYSINSQILDKELCIETDRQPVSRGKSPIINLNNDKLVLHSNIDLRLDPTKTLHRDILAMKQDKISVTNKVSTHRNGSTLEDEILFSSDEEDHPLTCGLKTSFYETSDVFDKTMYVGFQTAGDKAILINTDSYLKAKSVLHDVDKEIKETSLIEMVNMSDNLTTKQRDFDNNNGNGDNGDSNCNINNKIVDLNENSIQHSSVKELFDASKLGGFETANGKAIKTSQGTINERETILQDMNDDNLLKADFFKRFTGNKKFEGFKTASNKNIRISERAFARCRPIFDDIDFDTRDFRTNLNSSNNKEPAEHINYGSKELSMKTAEPSDEIKPTCKVQIHNENPIKEIEMKIVPDESRANIYKDSVQFKTASNKSIKFSDVALGKIKNVFQGIDLNSVDVEISTPKFAHFQTASNKRIDISEEDLVKSKKMFEEMDNNSGTINFGNEKAPFVGFQTASNKKVNISEQALVKTKQIFQDLDVDNNKFIGFKTANDKKIEVSESALIKTKDLFKDFDDEFITNNNNIGDSKDKTEKSRDLDNKKIELVKVNNNNILLNNKKEIDTEIIHHFEETLYTEDFYKSPKHKSSTSLKRSGSPIIFCPKAKICKRFETPYKIAFKISDDKIDNPTATQESTRVKIYTFDENYKKNKIYTMKDIDDLEMESVILSECDLYTSDYNIDSDLCDIKFTDRRNDLTDKPLSMEELKGIFLDSVNRIIVPDGWVDNHLKMIMWKLIHYEVRFPKTLRRVCTAKNVLDQLKHRYNRELFNVERPALRKILEKDDIPMKTLVLRVIGIYVDGVRVTSVPSNASNVEILLSDGWYCIKGSIDKMLSKLVCEKKIQVGTKIFTQGAELLNCDQGIAPWEDTSLVRLKLFGNSTRRARSDARLGYHGNGAILSRLSNVTPDGGKVVKLRFYVTRVYPTLYVEKFEDGSTVTRSERLENMHQVKYEADRQILLEKIYEEVEKELSDEESQESVDGKRKCLDTGSQIAKVMKRCKDPSEFITHLTTTQSKLLEDHTNKQMEKVQEIINNRVRQRLAISGLVRNVVMLVKIRIAGVDDNGVTKGMMSIWKPNEAILEILTEGAWIEVLNVVPTAIRYSEIHISAGRQSVFSKSKHKESDKIKTYTSLLKRKSYTINDLTQNRTITTDYNEIDTSGFIFAIDPSNKDFDSTKDQFQNVYLTDADKNIIRVIFWGGIKKFGYENLLDTGQIISCVNLQKRAGNTSKNIPQYRATEFTYFTRTPKNESLKRLQENLTKQFINIDRKKFCEDCAVIKNNYAVCKNNENISPYRFNNTNLSKTNIFIKSPLVQGKHVDENLNLSGLDFDSTFKRDSQELSPKTLQRKRKVNEKIAKLKMYGEPPPLTSIHLINKSKNATKSYQSPLILKNDVSSVDKTETSVNTEQSVGYSKDNNTSPVLNRTLVKRKCVNPIKLNFSNVPHDINADHFAEDFNASPPLSLDSC